MYTKEQLRDLRDTIIQENNAHRYSFKEHENTIAYLKEMLMFYSDPQELYKIMKNNADGFRHLLREPRISAIHQYVLAYDLLFGDVEVLPLHINDILDTIVKWRVRLGREALTPIQSMTCIDAGKST